MRPEAILESALYAADLDAARAFYGGFLGLEEIGHQPGRHVFFRVGAGILLVFNPNRHRNQRPDRPPARPRPWCARAGAPVLCRQPRQRSRNGATG